MGFFGGGASVANMVEATSSVAGTAGLCPAPAAGSHKLTLRGDATFYPAQPIIYSPSSSYSVGGANTYWTYPWLQGGSTGTFSALNCFFCPILIPKQDTYNRIAITVQTRIASSTIGLAIYDNDESNNLPKTLIASSSSGIATDTGATYALSFSSLLSAGWYHGAIIPSSGSLVFRIESAGWFPFYGNTTPWGGAGRASYTQAELTNARSSVTDFPSSIASSDITITGGAGIPLMGIRIV